MNDLPLELGIEQFGQEIMLKNINRNEIHVSLETNYYQTRKVICEYHFKHTSKSILMKIINTIKSIVLTSFDGQPFTATPELVDKILAPVEKNKLKILESTFTIERMLDSIISHYFFDRFNLENTEKYEMFDTLILSSDWCTFSAKRKLITHIINEKKLLKGKQKDDYENKLRKIMSYRNAFAHGELSTDCKAVKLKYFEGVSKNIVLDETFFNTVEETLNSCYKLTEELESIIGAVTSVIPDKK